MLSNNASAVVQPVPGHAGVNIKAKRCKQTTPVHRQAQCKYTTIMRRMRPTPLSLGGQPAWGLRRRGSYMRTCAGHRSRRPDPARLPTQRKGSHSGRARQSRRSQGSHNARQRQTNADVYRRTTSGNTGSGLDTPWRHTEARRSQREAMRMQHRATPQADNSETDGCTNSRARLACARGAPCDEEANPKREAKQTWGSRPTACNRPAGKASRRV